MASDRRDKLIDTALELFNRDGYHATGIDRILGDSGVAKMTLYNHFKSKDDLILAALRRRDERWRQWFQDAVESRSESPRKRLLAAFDALEEWIEGPDFRGCMFVKAASEYCDREDPIHAAAAEHQRLVLAYLRTLATAAKAARPAKLARELLLLIEGATVVSQINGPVGAAKQARLVAKTLIAQALPDPESTDARPSA